MLLKYSMIILALLAGNVFAQDYDLAAYKEKYKGEQAVQVVKRTRVTIDVKNDKPLVTTSYEDQYLLLDPKLARSFSEEEITTTSFDELGKIDAYSLMPNGKSFKKVKATNFQTRDKTQEGSVFHDDDKITSFYYPSLQEGSVRILEYSETTSEYRFPFGFFFQSVFPIETNEFVVDADTSVHLLLDLRNNGSGLVKKNEEIVRGRRITTYSMTGAKGLKFEEQSPSLRVYTPHIVGQIAYYTTKQGRQSVLETPADLHTWYQTNLTEVENEVPTEEITRLADSITKGSESELAKVKAIYYWVQNNIKYIAFEEGVNGFIPRQPSSVCRKRYGDCKDMAALIYSMLKSQNITAYLTWVGTRDLPYDYSTFPSAATDNHMIAVYETEDGTAYYLDATSAWQPMDYPPFYIQEKEVLIHKGTGDFEIRKVAILPPERTEFFDTSYVHIDGSKIAGNANVHSSGYYTTLIHDSFKNVMPEDLDKLMKNVNPRGNNTLRVTNSQMRNLDDREKPFIMSFDFEVNNYVSSYDKEIYVNPILNKDITHGEIREDRVAPLELGFYSSDAYVTVLDIPEGYTLKFVPENTTFTSDFVDYSVSYSEKDGQLMTTVRIKFKFLYLQPDQFKAWNDFVKIMKKSMSESVVLIKTQA